MAVYTVPFNALAVTTSADQNIWQITSATKPLIIHHFELYSATTSDERVKLKLMRYSSAGSGGAGATEVLLDPGSAALTGAVTQLVTTPGTDGDVLQAWYWSQLSPLVYLPTPECRPVVAVGGYLGLHLGTAVGAERAWSGFLTWEEIG
jgi:hypothetical protein